MWVPKLLLSSNFGPNLARNWHFWSFWARPCWLIWCTGWLVVVARVLYLARYLFTLSYPSYWGSIFSLRVLELLIGFLDVNMSSWTLVHLVYNTWIPCSASFCVFLLFWYWNFFIGILDVLNSSAHYLNPSFSLLLLFLLQRHLSDSRLLKEFLRTSSSVYLPSLARVS